MLKQLRSFIKNLKPKKIKTVWENYSVANTYEKSEENEKVKIVESDFQILENELFSEFSLPYIDQTQTPTQFLNEFVKDKYGVMKIITPQNLGPDAHEQIMLWGLTKARKLND